MRLLIAFIAALSASCVVEVHGGGCTKDADCGDGRCVEGFCTVSPPAIYSFTADKTIINRGAQTQLIAVFSDGIGTVDSGVGPIQSGVALPVSPTATTTYTLSVKNSAFPAVTSSVEITVVAPPAIASFQADAASITDGDTDYLHAEFSGGSGSIGADTGASPGPVTSGVPVPVQPSATTVYTLTVTNVAEASTERKLKVTVLPRPYITQFSADAGSVTAGDPVNLSATFGNGAGSVEPGGAITSGGTLTVYPPQTTTYTLIVRNALGASVARQLTVRVFSLPTIEIFAPYSMGFPPAELAHGIRVGYDAGTEAALTWQFTGAYGRLYDDRGALAGGLAPSGSYRVAPTVTTTYFLYAYNELGKSTLRPLILPVNGWARWPVPDSPTQFCIDQNGSYFCSGICSTAPYQGQDGCLQSPIPYYFVNDFGCPNNCQRTVFDNLTGLRWQAGGYGSSRTWIQAKTFCETLSFGGYGGWRLPSRAELLSLVDYGKIPTIDTSAFLTQPGPVWSSAPHPTDALRAYVVDVGSGTYFTVTNTATNYSAMCVRRDPPCSPNCN